MQLPPSNWVGCQSFVCFKNPIGSLKAMNDCAERLVKNVTEFINYVKDPDKQERVVIVIVMGANHYR